MTRPVALVTGATRGLGRALAARLAREYRLVTTGRHPMPAAAGIESLHLVGDAADPAHARVVAAEIRRAFGRLDLLVANAGIACDRLLTRTSEAEWDRTIAVNLSGVRHLLQAALPLLVESRGGAILVGSMLGLGGGAGAAAYAASKAGLIGLGLSVARELAPAGRLNIVIPGYLPTAMGRANPRARERARAEHLLGLDGSIEETAATIAFVATLKTATGRIFHVDGRAAAS